MAEDRAAAALGLSGDPGCPPELPAARSPINEGEIMDKVYTQDIGRTPLTWCWRCQKRKAGDITWHGKATCMDCIKELSEGNIDA